MPGLVAQLYALALEHADKATPTAIAAMAPATIIMYLVGLAFYRLWLHPLAGVPGPFWNKITFFVEFKHSDMMWKKIEEWHQKYGPIIRITPDEVHIDDALNIETFDQCHRVGTKWSKPKSWYKSFRGDNVTLFTTLDNASHRARRSVIHPVFSRKKVAELEPFVHGIVLNLVKLVKDNARKAPNNPFSMHRAFRCVALDTITSYALGDSLDLLHSDDLGYAFISTVRKHLGNLWLHKILPKRLVYTLTHLPPWLASRLDTSSGVLPRLRRQCMITIAKVKKDPDYRGEHGGRTMFHDMIWAHQASPDEAENVVPEELDEAERQWLIAARKEQARNVETGKAKYLIPEEIMPEEMGSSVIAGVDSTGLSMEVLLLIILTHPEVRERFTKEINAAFPDGIETHKWQGLERIPYVNACIKEGLRMANGVMGRFPRTCEEDGFSFKGYQLPRGTIVSQTTRMHHRHPELFPDPDTFRPERWLEDGKRLEKYLNPFGKGSRSCAGRELAYCEIYLSVAGVVCAFPDMKIAESSGLKSYDEIEWHDNFLTFIQYGNRGVEVVV